MQHCFNPTRGTMEDDFIFFFKWKMTSIFGKWKTTSILLKMEDDINFWKMEDNLNFWKRWNRSDTLQLTLKKNIKIVETRHFYNPAFTALPFGQKLAKFQNMWIPDQESFNFFSCMNEHFRRNRSKCDNFCGSLTSPFCGHLAYFL